ncbi:MAG: hypothetical protein ACI4TZ_03435, partial [Christensenellales bacterium]
MDIEEEIKILKQRIKVLEELLNVNAKTNNEDKQDNNSNRDKTKYMFNGKVLPKNRLVLNVIKEYTKQNNPTLSDLQQIFDKTLQGSRMVVERFDAVKKITDYKKRYFTDDSDILNLKNGEQACVCTQWGIFNIKKFILVA